MYQQNALDLQNYPFENYFTMPQRIKYINAEGHPHEQVLQIIKRKSKEIIVRDPNDDHVFSIPRHSVESISDPKKEKDKDTE